MKGGRQCLSIAALLLVPATSYRVPEARAGLRESPYFENLVSQAGIRYLNLSGEPEKSYITSSIGSGLCLFDYDEDGDLDLYWVNGAETKGLEVVRSAPNQLYRNDGEWVFRDVTEEAGVGHRGWGIGCAAADYDNDGDLDIYVTNLGANVLYENQGDGTFVDVTAEAAVGDLSWGASAAWIDSEGDGDLDLYVTNYVDPSLKKIPLPGTGIVHAPGLMGDIYCRFQDVPVFCGPTDLVGASDVFYRNNGDGTFSRATEASGLFDPSRAYGLGVVVLDYDDDGLPDLYVSNDAVANFLFRNRGDGTFQEVGLEAGVAYNENGEAEAGMGVDAGDVNGDGRLDLFVTNFSHQTNTFYLNLGKGLFADRTEELFHSRPSWPYLGWATRFMDLDLDADQDLFVANGHVFPRVDDRDTGTTYRQQNQIFWNEGDGRFREAEFPPDDAMGEEESSRGGAFGDIDNDGYLDAAIVNIDARGSLLRNNGGARASSHWIGFRLIGRKSNRDAIGARLSLRSERRVQVREVRPSGSFLSSNDVRVHFGLGPSDRVGVVRIRWPNGRMEELSDLTHDRYHTIVEPGSISAPGMGES